MTMKIIFVRPEVRYSPSASSEKLFAFLKNLFMDSQPQTLYNNPDIKTGTYQEERYS